MNQLLMLKLGVYRKRNSIMEKEKAIEILNALSWVQGGADREETIAAISMAIEALQAETIPLSVADKIGEEREQLQDKVAELQEEIAELQEKIIDRPHGKWICKGDYAECSECGDSSGTQFDGVEPIPRITAFCPHCGADMRERRET